MHEYLIIYKPERYFSFDNIWRWTATRSVEIFLVVRNNPLKNVGNPSKLSKVPVELYYYLKDLEI